MADNRAFVYVVCGAAVHMRTLHRSLECLRPRTSSPIVVVTDSRRNEIPIEHDTVIDIETPSGFDHHQASIFLKTSLHHILPGGRVYAYLDADVIATDTGVDAIFEHASGPVTFARDLTHLDSRVATFSPWAVRCGCPTDQGLACGHLADAIAAKFQVHVPNDWMHWNGGVFLFGPESAAFMDTWHRLTLEMFEDPYWKTRDQGTLIATVWILGFQDQRCLPAQFDFIVDDNNPDLCFDRTTGYSLHESIPRIHPSFLHLYHADLGRPGWNLAADVEGPLEARSHARDARVVSAPSPSHEVGSVGGVREVPQSTYDVIVGVPRGSVGGHDEFAESLVRSLRELGTNAGLLLTESRPIASDVPPASDVPIVALPVAQDASWGTRWGTLVRVLEEQAPCIYMPVGDWRHSNVSAHLSERVRIVGVVRDDNPLDLDQVDRLGCYWNAIVCATPALAARVADRHPELADRIVMIPAAESVSDDVTAAWAALFGRIMEPEHGFTRPKGLLRKPPYHVGHTDVLPVLYFRGIAGVGVFPSYREDYEDYRSALGPSQALRVPEWRPELVQPYPVIVAAPAVPDPAADRVVRRLASGLQNADHQSHVLVASGARSALETGRFGTGVAVCDLQGGPAFWRTDWRALVKHLERHAPCLFLTGGDECHSRALPHLSREVGVIARVDDLSPASLERVRTTGRFCDALVAGDPTIAAHLADVDPALASRIVTIPVLDVPGRMAVRALPWHAPLEVVVAGEASEIAALGTALADAGVPVALTDARDQTPAVFAGRDVFVVLGDAGRHWAQVVHAMGQGCLPVVTRGSAAVADLVQDEVTGYCVPNHDGAALVARLSALQKNPALCRGLAVRAFARMMADDLIPAYMTLFERVLREIEFALHEKKGRRDTRG